MTWKLFLDDERFSPNGDGWIIARSYKEAVRLIEANDLPSFISFDHDLGNNSKSGLDFAKWFANYIIENNSKEPVYLDEDFGYYVHSQNPVGAKAIRDYMEWFLQGFADGMF